MRQHAAYSQPVLVRSPPLFRTLLTKIDTEMEPHRILADIEPESTSILSGCASGNTGGYCQLSGRYRRVRVADVQRRSRLPIRTSTTRTEILLGLSPGSTDRSINKGSKI